MDGFDLLREAFKKFANSVDAEDIGGRVVRSVGAGGKALTDKALEEFPQSFVKGLVSDFYAMIGSQEIADGISMTVRGYDEEKIKDVLDLLVSELKKDEVASKLAKQLKDGLSQASNDDIQNALEALLSDRSMQEQMLFRVFFSQAKPILDDLRDGTEEEITEKIKELADTIPTDLIAMQAGALTQEVTPERVAKQIHDAIGKLPSPAAISGIVEELGQSASAKFAAVSKAKTLSDATGALADFAADAAAIVQSKLANDNASKGKLDKKKGGDFKF